MKRRRGDPPGPAELQRIGALSAPELTALQDHGLTRQTRAAARELARQRERAFGQQLRTYLRVSEEIRVAFHRPRWLPEWAYRRLLKSISIETRGAPTMSRATRPTERPERRER